MTEYTQYDLRDIYEKEIAPRMKDIAAICEMHRLPFFATYCIANGSAAKSGKGSDYANFSKMPGSSGLALMDDKLTSHMMVEAGFEVADGSSIPDIITESYGDDPFAGMY